MNVPPKPDDAPSKHPSRDVGSPERLLIVDDEKQFGEFVQRVAERLGFMTKVTTSAREFMMEYESFCPTVVTLDMVMPGRDGLSLVEWLMKIGCTARVIIITGFNPGHAALAQMEGARHGTSIVTLAKPISIPDLQAALLGRGRRPGG